jgi:hypothetical protein
MIYGSNLCYNFPTSQFNEKFQNRWIKFVAGSIISYLVPPNWYYLLLPCRHCLVHSFAQLYFTRWTAVINFKHSRISHEMSLNRLDVLLYKVCPVCSRIEI